MLAKNGGRVLNQWFLLYIVLLRLHTLTLTLMKLCRSLAVPSRWIHYLYSLHTLQECDLSWWTNT